MRRSVFAVLLVASAGCSGHGAQRTAALSLSACHLTNAEAGASTDGRCGTLKVPLDRESEGRELISLRVAVVPAIRATAKADPIFILVGGPGQAATSVYPLMEESFSHIHIARDIVLVDQRGTGGSAPLDCPEAKTSPLDDDVEKMSLRAEACSKLIGPRARFFGTEAFADDLDAVRAALGYEKITLYGASYGTGAAMVYGARHPEHLRAMILDGVMSLTAPHSQTTARDAEDALLGLFAECAADDACRHAFPDPKGDLTALLDRLATPVLLSVPNPLTEEPLGVRMTRDLLADAVFNLSYETETSTLLPLLLHNAKETGDFVPLVRTFAAASAGQSVSFALHLAVLCGEHASRLDREKGEVAAAGTYLGDSKIRLMMQACKSWPQRPASETGPHKPVLAPTLLLSSDLDPVTPPRNAEAALPYLPHGRSLVLHGQGHGALARGCVRRIAEAFLENASTADLDTSCLREAHDVRFFTSFAGTAP